MHGKSSNYFGLESSDAGGPPKARRFGFCHRRSGDDAWKHEWCLCGFPRPIVPASSRDYADYPCSTLSSWEPEADQLGPLGPGPPS
jgi:hypothetical protein